MVEGYIELGLKDEALARLESLPSETPEVLSLRLRLMVIEANEWLAAAQNTPHDKEMARLQCHHQGLRLVNALSALHKEHRNDPCAIGHLRLRCLLECQNFCQALRDLMRAFLVELNASALGLNKTASS